MTGGRIVFVYADHAATTRLCDEALQAMLPCFQEVYGNPSSPHSAGRQAKQKLEQARTAVAECLGCDSREVIFTSGGSESDNQAILTAAALGEECGRKHIVSTAFEHHAVLNTLKKLESQGFSVTYLPVDPKTHNIGAEQVKHALRPDTCLVSTMYANNEIGSILPVEEIGRICREAGVLFHTDGVQAAGQIPVNVQQAQIDFFSLSGHKFGGPKGIGALYVRKGIQLRKLLEGGGQERGKRPGTENLPAICGMAAALGKASSNLEETGKRVSALRDRLIAGLSEIPGSYLNGDPVHRLPGNVNFSFENIEGEILLVLLDSKGICGSSGSACSSGSLEPSHVLLAAGRSAELSRGSLRLSLSGSNTEEEVDYILKVVPEVVENLRKGF